VFDMGGGTLDIAVLHVRGGPHPEVSVLAAYGIAEAGDALDETIAEDLDFELARIGIDLDAVPHPRRARERLKHEARTAKLMLSVEDEHPIVLSPQVFGRPGEIWYTRERLNEVFLPQMERAEDAVRLTLMVARIADLGQSAADIARTSMDELVDNVDVVLLSGGMSRVPYVKQRLEWLFNPATTVDLVMEPPENAVAVGLARAGEYGKINMFRPAFDIQLEWDKGREFRPIYEAFTPLVERGQVAGGDAPLRYVRTGRQLSVPPSAKGRLRVVSHSGERLRATLAGRSLDGFAVSLNGEKFEFSIYPNGRIQMSDGTGEYDGWVEDWHRLDPS
jgi:hypothetical protein